MGNPVKLEYPFNSAACLEVEYKPGTWVRVTPREFRSYNCPRRISQMQGKEYVTEEYIGPTYYFGSNKKIGKTNRIGIHYLHDINPRTQVKDTRPFIGRL